ncbi:MAG: DNA-cytosine methyltransferase, partial [Hyphomicrobiales bacterium]|nr:DNA-cytosine methyltransferase [Hyphomicrobiales bacterium]
MHNAANIEAVDVFCGLGGLSLGLQASGIDVRAGIDVDPACRAPFERNIGACFIERNVEELDGCSLVEHFSPGAIRVLAGCAPCQPFSGYTTKRRKVDQRWRLLLEFQRLVNQVNPSVITLENVPRLAHLDLWEHFVSGLRRAHYEVVWDVLDAADFGIPQSRKRLVLLASKLGSIQLPKPVPGKLTVRDAIGYLRPICAGEIDSHDHMHAARVLTPKNLQRIKCSQPAGTWRDWPENLKADCHRRASGHTYPSVYGRMSWDQPSPTVTTQFF